jgi:hypothetical protein
MDFSMYDIALFLFSFLASLVVALSAVKFDRWLADKKELELILLSLGFEMAENISIARTIAKKAEEDIKTIQNMKHPFAPFPTFSDLAYYRAKNSDVFFHFVNNERTGGAKELVKNLHECYNSIRLVNSMMQSEQQVKLEIMMGRCPKEYEEQLLATTQRTVREVIEPQLIKTLLLLGQIEPKLHKVVSLLSEISKDQNVRTYMESRGKEKPEKPAGHKRGKASALVWLAFIPLLIAVLIAAWMLPCFLVSSFPQTQIQSYGFPPHVESTLELKLAITDINPDFCTFTYTMRYRVEVNHTEEADFHMLIIPKGNGPCGVGVPFGNLKFDGVSYSFNATSWTDYNTYSYSGEMTLPIPYKSPEQFPADTYASSTIYVWFSKPVYPKVNINLYSSIPKSFIVSIRELGLISPEALYNQFDIGDKLFMGKPSVDVLAFQVVVQRDRSSLILYSAYVIFITLIIYYSATLSRIASIELPNKLQMFVGLSIAVVAFLWSVRPVVGTITIAEVGLMFGLFVWLLIEIRDWYRRS